MCFKLNALSSKELDKYEYLTGEDLRYKSEVAEQGIFGYFSMGKVFNKRLKEDDKKRQNPKKTW